MNGVRLTFSNDEAYDFIYGIACGKLDDVTKICPTARRRNRASRVASFG